MLQWTSGCMYLFGLWFSLDKCPGLRLLDHMIALFLVFWGVSIPFSIVAVPVYIPTNNVGGFPFLYTLSIIYCLAMGVLTGVRWNLMVVFIYNFLIISDVEHLFMWCLNLYVFFGEMCIYIFCPLFDWVVFGFVLFFFFFFFLHKAAWIVCILWRLIPCWSLHLQRFPPVLWVIFSFVYGFLCCTEAFKLN